MSPLPLIVARKELREMSREWRLWWSAAIVWLLVAGAVATAWPEHRRRMAEREALSVTSRDHWLSQGSKNPHTAAHFGLYAIKAHTPLSLFDPGVTIYLGTHVLLEAHWQNPQQGRMADRSPASYRLGALSPAGILQQLLPLVIILLGYQAIAGERERGTWSLLTTQGVSAIQVGAGKFIAIAGALLTVCVPPFVLAVIAATSLASDPDSIARAAALTALYSLYGVTWLALTLWRSAVAVSARRALIVLLAFWIASTLVLPRAVADVSRVIFRTPSAFSFHEAIYAQKARGIDGHDPEDARVEALRQRTFQTYGVTSVDDLPVNFGGLALQADEEYGIALFERAYGGLWETFDRQAELQRAAGFVTPTQAIRFASMALAGTDAAHDRAFADAAERYRQDLVRTMNDDLTYRSKSGDFSYAGDRATWARVGEFRHQTPSIAWALGREWLSCVLLSAWCIASIAGFFSALRSDSVRPA